MRAAAPIHPPEAASPFLDNLVLFGRVLRRAGLRVSLDQTLGLARALRIIDLGNRNQVFYTMRSLLVTRREDLELFRQLFDRFWSAPAEADARPQRPRRARRPASSQERPLELVRWLARPAGQNDPEIDVTDRRATWSDVEMLRRKEFAEMSSEEIDAIQRMMASMRWRLAERRTRRLVSDAAGSTLDLRRSLTEIVRYGAPLRLAWRSRKIKQRPLVLLADTSGSMERYSRLIFQFFYCVSQRLSGVETFVFGTRLTRLTPHLELRNVDRALDDAAREVQDWAGGTRIGESLRAFNREWSRRVVRRGAVVVIISDGWERGDASLLAREMRYLHHRCHRLIWLNPLLGHESYEPRVEGMAAALPHVDDFLPIHNLASLEELCLHLGSLPRTPGRKGDASGDPRRLRLLRA